MIECVVFCFCLKEPHIEWGKKINLHTFYVLSCFNIQYKKRDGMQGVSYCADGREEGWTPVTGKRLKRAVPLHLLHHRAPPHIEARLLSDSESMGGSDCSDVELTMPILSFLLSMTNQAFR